MLKASLKRCVFSCPLKISTESEHLMANGSLFHKIGAILVNALSPKVAILVLGTTRAAWSHDLKLCVGVYGIKR